MITKIESLPHWNFTEVEGCSHRKFLALGLGWSKQALSPQGHKAFTVQEQSFQGGGDTENKALTTPVSVPKMHSWPGCSCSELLLLGWVGEQGFQGRGSWQWLLQRAEQNGACCS